MTAKTPLKDYYAKLSAHDWTYAFSDDSSVYRRGAAEESAICRIAAETPAHAALYEAWRRYAFTPASERGPKPELPET